MKNWLIILLVAAVVIGGAFLPELLLMCSPPPELNMQVQQVAVTALNSSDYIWRMDTLAESWFGEGEQLRTTYISQPSAEDGQGEEYALFLSEFDRLSQSGILPRQVRELLREDTDCRIRIYYMFDSLAVNGFRYGELTASGSGWKLSAFMDMESGRIVRLDYGGTGIGTAAQSSWYDVLRSFGQYLGLSDTASAGTAVETQGARKYYDSVTVDRRTAPIGSGGSAWLELRVLRENDGVRITVYRGGK